MTKDVKTKVDVRVQNSSAILSFVHEEMWDEFNEKVSEQIKMYIKTINNQKSNLSTMEKSFDNFMVSIKKVKTVDDIRTVSFESFHY